MSLLCVVFFLAIASCRKDAINQINDNRSVIHRTSSVRQNDGSFGQPRYVTSSFQYDSLGRCVFQHIDSGNVDLIWKWGTNQLRVERYANGSTIMDTFWVINLNNDGLMTDGNLWGFYETAIYNSNLQRTFTVLDYQDGYHEFSTNWFWSNGNIDSSVTIGGNNVVWTPTKYTYYSGTINTISPIYWGRTYEGANNLNLTATEAYFDWGTSNWKTTSYSYEFDSLNRAIVRVGVNSNGHVDTTFYTYY